MNLDEPAAPGTVLRPTARVLLIDDRDRTLLFLMVSEDVGDTFWFPPGGALEGDESYEEAASRELTEETGWANPIIGPLIGYRRHLVTWTGIHYDSREQWFLTRVPSLTVDTAGFTEEERLEMLESRWWSVDELRATADRLAPPNLADLLERILLDGAPAEPIDLPM